MERLISFIGLFVMIGLAWLLSSHKRKISVRMVVGGLLLQFSFAFLTLRTTPGLAAFEAVGDAVTALLRFVDQGSDFMFGIPPEGDAGSRSMMLLRTFAFGVLPTIIFFSSLMSVLYHFGVMQFIVKVVAVVMQKTLNTSGAESLSAASNIFVGQTEAPLIIRPYVSSMTQSELMAVMVGGFATVAGGVMAAYVKFGVDAGHLVTASVISAPAALLIAKVMQPEVDQPKTRGKVELVVEKNAANVIEAAAIGASDGMKLAINVGAMLIAFLALIALANALVGWVGSWFNQVWTLEAGLSYAFAPLAWLMGCQWEDCFKLGELLGIRMVGNEFLAYIKLGEWIKEGSQLSHRSQILATYALCGFANFSSIGIQIGGIGAIAPNRQGDLARLGLRAMLGGTIACFMTACVAGVIIDTDEPPPAQPAKEATAVSTTLRVVESGHGECRDYDFCDNVNLPGSKSLRSTSNGAFVPVLSTSQIGRVSQNSARNWRQAPQGVTPPGLATAKAMNRRLPAAIAAETATRSAQIVNPYDAFSTLQPANVCPSSLNTAAPTRKPEYLAYACCCAAKAAAIKGWGSNAGISARLLSCRREVLA